MFQLEIRDHFDSAHMLPNYIGKCGRMHGHRWRVVVLVQGQKLNGMGMLVDFCRLKEILKAICEQLDHRVLNDLVPIPTAEYLAKHIYNCFVKMWADLQETKVRCLQVSIWENPDCCATYFEEQQP